MKRHFKALRLIMALLLVVSTMACGAPAQPEQATPAPVQPSAAPADTAPAPTPEPEPEATPITVTDHAGRAITIASPPQRIVSGYYISSSLCIALGLTDRLVGIETKADSRPIYHMAAPSLLDLPSVGSAKEFDLEGCIALAPELVILPARLKDIADTLEGLGINVLLVNPESQKELEEVIAMIAAATGTDDRGEALIRYYSQMREFMSSLTVDNQPSVYLVGGELLRTAPANMYQNSVIENAHGVNVAADIEGSTWVDISYEQLIGYNPDYIVIAPEAGVTVDAVLADTQLSELNAVKNGHVYKMPTSFEAWDSPVPSGILGSLWLLNILHESVYDFDAFAADAAEFYRDFYNTDINTQELGEG